MTDNPITYLVYGVPDGELCAMFFPSRENAEEWMHDILPGTYRLMALDGIVYDNLRVLTVEPYSTNKRWWRFGR